LKTLRLLALAIRYHWDAQKSTPANLIAAIGGMMINNSIILWGLWVMLFDGKPDSEQLTVYFLSLNSMVTLAWGSLTFFIGGIRLLARYAEEGSLDSMLATPRNPLILIGISASETPALGDILQGLCSLAALSFLAPGALVVRCIFFTIVSAVGFLGLFILTGSIPFFIRRGSALADLVLECNLSLSFYPTGKIFTDKGRYLIYLTPAAFTAILPITAIESGGWGSALTAIAGATIFLWLAIQFFFFGIKRYQSTNYVGARG
jgi:ABC-2 type transport system permease protein